ncbi:hypothetical protein PQR02_07065 [Paraburkholderia sediminicola]|uniref:Uncharacterized protein n=1 Tax=Paraburkholderia rhynchosiae TaxID=487049 RepID=A0ACC7N600_9BURK
MDAGRDFFTQLSDRSENKIAVNRAGSWIANVGIWSDKPMAHPQTYATQQSIA